MPKATDTHTTRRLMLRGASITAIAAAALPAVLAAGEASPSQPDAALIALCHTFEGLAVEMRAIGDGPNRVSDDAEAARQTAPIQAHLADLVAQMHDMRATSPAGVHARMRALAAYDPDHEYDTCTPGYVCADMYHDILRDAALVPMAGRA